MKAVKFLKEHMVTPTLYNEGEVAGFEDAVADALVEAEVAEIVTAEAPASE